MRNKRKIKVAEHYSAKTEEEVTDELLSNFEYI